MNQVQLGRTGLSVSKICFGALTIGPLQANLPVRAGAAVIRCGLEYGINFIDTAELYGTYAYIKEALRGWSSPVVIASKSYAYTRKDMAASLEKARRGMNRDVIEIFLLHEQESALTLRGHRPALDFLLEAKTRGLVRAVGISTHTVAGVEAAAAMPEIDVIHPIFNQAGLGILDGTREDMYAAIIQAWRAGKGIYAMKPIGGGNLIADAENALRYVLNQPAIHAVAVGMKTVAEVEMNVAIAEGRPVPAAVRQRVNQERRCLHIEDWCAGCGTCVDTCRYAALAVVNGKLQVDPTKCLLCGYCGAACPQFCIKII